MLIAGQLYLYHVPFSLKGAAGIRDTGILVAEKSEAGMTCLLLLLLEVAYSFTHVLLT